MLRAVVDTNILIRAVIMPSGTVGPVITRLRERDYTLVYSQPLMDELLEKLALPRIRKKYHLNDQDIDALLALIALRGELVTPTRKVKICRDPKDDMFIEAALASNAEVIVTGDEDLLTLKKFETVRFFTPRVFLALLDQRQQVDE
jgi:putative PIN family toxin of toxin-antitoxin system